MNPFSNINHIPWKYVLGMNLTFLVLAVSFTSINTVRQSTENRSQAEDAPYGASPTLTQISITPGYPPKLINPDVSWGKVGDDVVVIGENLGTKPFGILKLGDQVIPTSQLIDWTPTQIVFTIPAKATGGLITLTVKTTSEQEINLSTTIPLTITDQNRF